MGVDTLTGDHHVVRTNIVMDVSESLNPAIDIGQIEGACTSEYTSTKWGIYELNAFTYLHDRQ